MLRSRPAYCFTICLVTWLFAAAPVSPSFAGRHLKNGAGSSIHSSVSSLATPASDKFPQATFSQHDQTIAFFQQNRLPFDLGDGSVRLTLSIPVHSRSSRLAQANQAGLGLCTLGPPKTHYKITSALPLSPHEETLVKDFRGRFTTAIEKLSFKHIGVENTRGHRTFSKIKAVLLYIPKRKDQSKLMPMVYLKSESGNTPYQKPDELNESFEALLRSVLFNHAGYLHTLATAEEEVHAEQHDLCNWLLRAFFEGPTSDHLPVLGEVKIESWILGRDGFGPMQQLIIDGLSPNKNRRNYHKLASSIIGIWTKTYHPYRWEEFKNEREFWKLMDDLTDSFRKKDVSPEKGEEKMSVDVESHTQMSQSTKDKSHLASMSSSSISVEGLPLTIKNTQEWIISKNSDQKLKHAESLIMNEMKRFAELCSLRANSLRTMFDDVPVSLAPLKFGFDQKQKVIRLVNMSKDTEKYGKIMTVVDTRGKLNKFLHGIEKHLPITPYFLECKNNRGIPDPRLQLVNWLHEEMFRPQDSQLPLFGIVELGENFKPLSSEAFGEVQIHIMRFICEPLSKTESIAIFSELIKIWMHRPSTLLP